MRCDNIVPFHKDALFRRIGLWAMATHRGDMPCQPRELASRWDDLARFAERNEIAPHVAHALMDTEIVQGDELLRWKRIHERSGERLTCLMEVLDLVADALACEDIRLVALKNAGIARGLSPCKACNPMGDLDVLVDRVRFRDAHRILVDTLGFSLDTRSTVEAADIEEGLDSGGTEYFKTFGEHEVWFELQWRPVAGRWIRPDQEPKGLDMIERSVPIEGTSVRLLEPSDNLVQVALHTAKHSFVRAPGLRLHTDVDRVVHHASPDPGLVAEKVLRLGVKTPVFFSLAMAQALLNTPVSRDLLNAIAPQRVKTDILTRWIKKLDVFEPQEKKFNRVEHLVFHALLYDEVKGLTASVLDVEPDELSWTQLPTHLRSGAHRVYDLLTRYQRE